jgi:hypothetical protein
MAVEKYNDYPLDEIIAEINRKSAQMPKAKFYQKFTCAGCGSRLTMPDANTFHPAGACDKCSVITNIRSQGCNYLVVMTY